LKLLTMKTTRAQNSDSLILKVSTPCRETNKKEYTAVLKENPFKAEFIGMENSYNNKIINSKRDYIEYANSYAEDLKAKAA